MRPRCTRNNLSPERVRATAPPIRRWSPSTGGFTSTVKLGDELRKGGDKLSLLLRNAKETLKALNVELVETTEERANPIALLGDSCEQSRRVLSAPGGS